MILATDLSLRGSTPYQGWYVIPRKIWQPCAVKHWLCSEFGHCDLLQKVAGTRVARFLLVRDTQTGKNVPNNTKWSKWSRNFPNVLKIFLMAIKYFNIFQSKALKNLPKVGFLV
jgi:hypothetical protein